MNLLWVVPSSQQASPPTLWPALRLQIKPPGDTSTAERKGGAIAGPWAGFERRDIWDVLWATDDPHQVSEAGCSFAAEACGRNNIPSIPGECTKLRTPKRKAHVRYSEIVSKKGGGIRMRFRRFTDKFSAVAAYLPLTSSLRPTRAPVFTAKRAFVDHALSFSIDEMTPAPCFAVSMPFFDILSPLSSNHVHRYLLGVSCSTAKLCVLVIQTQTRPFPRVLRNFFFMSDVAPALACILGSLFASCGVQPPVCLY